MHTEEQAKKKYCPYQDRDKGTMCATHECMAWRWVVSPSMAAETNARGDAGLVAKGYCGLAGHPNG
jgi:hypothetical protein